MEYLKDILDKTVKNNRQIFGAALSVYHDGNNWDGVSGNFKMNELFFIASTTKLFTSALIFKLRHRGVLDLSDRISKHLSNDILDKLHVYKGKDYSSQITIANLLAHTSGLPDYFMSKQKNKGRLESQLTNGKDRAWNFQQTLAWTKQMKPLFKPSESNKAHYSDTNYQLLGKLIEKLFNRPYSGVIQSEICAALGLKQTYLYTESSDNIPKPLFYKSNQLIIPKAMASFGPDGGIVSTSNELMVFLKAFMEGQIFPKSYLKEICTWKKIFYPLEAGTGVHRFKAPWYFSPFNKIPEMIGHSGLSGSFAYYAPEIKTYLTGTVNQIYRPGNAYKLMIKLVSEIMKRKNI